MPQACLDWATSWVDRWAAREGDTLEERVTKRLFTASFGVMSPAYAIGFLSVTERDSTIGQCVTLGVVSCCLCLLLYLRVVRTASTRFVWASSFVILASVLGGDFVRSAEENRRTWPAAILLIDVLLVIQAQESLTIGSVACMCVYLIVIQLEQWLRFGLYDLPGLAPYEVRAGYGDCGEPPCARSASMTVNIMFVSIAIFLLDFYFTRGFALQVRREKEKIAAAVAAAEQVAERLASLDLDAAEAVLQGSEDVPPGLCESLYTILHHLKGYKPFLPQAVMLPVALCVTLSDEASTTDEQSSAETCSSHSPHSGASKEHHARSIREYSIFRLTVKRVSLLRLHPSLPVVSDATFLPSHSRVLEAVLGEAVSCKGVVDHFCGDVVNLSYNATVTCASHSLMAVKTAAALCLDTPQGLCELRGAVVTGKAHVGVLGVPELRRHCIVGTLATVCRNIEEGAGILRHQLLCSHGVAIEVACVQPTRVLLDRFVFDTTRHDDCCDSLTDIVHEVLACGAGDQRGPTEWMYELAQLSADEWEAYNKAGNALLCEGNVEDAVEILRSSGVPDERITLFTTVAAAARILDFRISVAPVSGTA